MPLFRSRTPFAFRTLFATTAPSTSPDTRYFSTIDAVGAVSAIELRNFDLPYDFRVVGCSVTLYNTSGSPLSAGGSVEYRLATKAAETSTSPSVTYQLLNFTLPTIAATAMTSNYSIITSDISISAGTNLAIQAVFTSLVGASLRGELTLYIVPV
jgi:hypothetical protein